MDSQDKYSNENYSELIKKKFPEDLNIIINISKAIASELNCRLFLVGGVVRDLILGIKNYDVDFVVEGDGLIFAEKLNNIVGGNMTVYRKFNTVKIVINKGIVIDIATARREVYESPAVLPQVEKSSIECDLSRRDFTINALAISLNDNTYGELLDYFYGKKDLINRKIKILHNASFIEDPLRIFRAIRFKHRLNLEIEENTWDLAKKAVESGIFDKITIERVIEELYCIFKEDNNTAMLQDLNKLFVLYKIFPEITSWDNVYYLFNKCNESIKWFSKVGEKELVIDKILLYVMIFCYAADDENLVCKKFGLSKVQIDTIKNICLYGNHIIKELNKGNLTAYEIVTILKGINNEALVLLTAISYNKKEVKTNIKNYFNNIKQVELCITGKEIRECGIKPGPLYKTILDRIYKEKVNGNIHTKEEELELLKVLTEKSREDELFV